MNIKKYYLRMLQERVDDFIPLSDTDITPEMFQFLYDRFCRAITWETFLFSTRARNCLERNKIDSMWGLKHLSRAAIGRLPWVGRKVRDELYTVIKEETGIKLHNLLEI